MADDSELDYLRTFISKVHTAATVKHIEEQPAIHKIGDAERILVKAGELMTSTFYSSIKRHEVQVQADTEANLMAAINNIIAGIRKLENWQTITDYTRESSLHHIELLNGGKPEHNGKNKRWEQTLILRVEWGA